MKQLFEPESVSAQFAPHPHLSVSREGEDTAPAKPLTRMTTLGELGPNMPVGIVVGSARVRQFRCRPFRLKEERVLAKLKDDSKGSTIGKFVCGVLSTMLQTIGPHNLDGMKANERLLLISQLSMGDVLYMYLYLRHDALGNEPVVMQVKCLQCTHEFRWFGDLATLEVRMVTDECLDIARPYEMRDGFDVRGANRKKITLSPMLWNLFMKPEYQDKAKQESLGVMASIVACEGVESKPFLMSENELDELTKFDLAGIVADIEHHSPGPQMIVEPKCPLCSTTFRMMLDWGYDSFFARSVLPTRTRT